MPTIKVSQDTYALLLGVSASLQVKMKKKVSMDEAVMSLSVLVTELQKEIDQLKAKQEAKKK